MPHLPDESKRALRSASGMDSSGGIAESCETRTKARVRRAGIIGRRLPRRVSFPVVHSTSPCGGRWESSHETRSRSPEPLDAWSSRGASDRVPKVAASDRATRNTDTISRTRLARAARVRPSKGGHRRPPCSQGKRPRCSPLGAYAAELHTVAGFLKTRTRVHFEAFKGV
jgi:hypothetical protein